jgi:hypothetical protein
MAMHGLSGSGPRRIYVIRSFKVKVTDIERGEISGKL